MIWDRGTLLERGSKVSTPLTWAELARGIDPRVFTIKTMGARVKTVGDVWAGIHRERLNFSAAMKMLGQTGKNRG